MHASRSVASLNYGYPLIARAPIGRRPAPSTVVGTTPQKRPTSEARAKAIWTALSGIADRVELGELAELLEPLHLRNSSFPGEVLLELAADAIEEAGATRGRPLEFEGMRKHPFPEHRARTKAQHRKAEYALRAAAMVRRGVDPGLPDEVIWWRTDDLWFWALEALVTYVRAAAERRAETVPVICGRIAVRQGVELAAPIDLDGQNAPLSRLRKHRMSASPRRTARGTGDRRRSGSAATGDIFVLHRAIARRIDALRCDATVLSAGR